MSINEINIKIETLKEWEAIAAEASAMVESIKDEIKRHMDWRPEHTLSVIPQYFPIALTAQHSSVSCQMSIRHTHDRPQVVVSPSYKKSLLPQPSKVR